MPQTTLNDLINSNRQEIADKLLYLARSIHFGVNSNCFIVGNHLISLTAGPITDLETLNNDAQPTHSDVEAQLSQCD